jgi:hypothetical protein
MKRAEKITYWINNKKDFSISLFSGVVELIIKYKRMLLVRLLQFI